MAATMMISGRQANAPTWSPPSLSIVSDLNRTIAPSEREQDRQAEREVAGARMRRELRHARPEVGGARIVRRARRAHAVVGRADREDDADRDEHQAGPEVALALDLQSAPRCLAAKLAILGRRPSLATCGLHRAARRCVRCTTPRPGSRAALRRAWSRLRRPSSRRPGAAA